jgi:hypothetical protein
MAGLILRQHKNKNRKKIVTDRKMQDSVCDWHFMLSDEDKSN